MQAKRFLALILAPVFLAASVMTLSTVTSAQAANPNCTANDGDYIVTFTKNTNVKKELSTAPGRAITPTFVYESVLNGFAATLSAEQVCAFRKRPNIDTIEADQIVRNQVSTQSLSSDLWSLDRVDSLSKNYDAAYSFTSTGSGVSAYVVDTGINSQHVDLAGRVRSGFSAIRGSKTTEDCNGHGTHVAGSIGGSTYGIAKQVTLVAVRVLSCTGSGSNSGVIAGLDWILKNNGGPAKSVVNMSLGGGISSTLDSAVTKLTNAGITVVVAAGNSSANACNSSPARVPSAITVAASDRNDVFASFSNFGTCVDIIAPGVSIKSSWIGSTTATNTISGTSMASPHVAGAVARYLANNRVVANLFSNGSSNLITGNLNGTPNKFIYLDPLDL